MGDKYDRYAMLTFAIVVFLGKPMSIRIFLYSNGLNFSYI